MIRHAYLIRLKDKNTAQLVIDKLSTLQEMIPEISKLELGINFTSAPNAYDIYQSCDFMTKEDFDIFTTHCYHNEVRKWLKDYTAEAVKVDYYC